MRTFSSFRLLLATFALCFVGGMICLASGMPSGKARPTLPARAQGTTQLNLDGTYRGVVYYPNGNLRKEAKLVIRGGNFRIEEGNGRRLLSGTISASLEIMRVRGVPRRVSFGVMQIDGGPKIDLRPHRSGSTIKLLNRNLDGNPTFRFCSMDSCTCRKGVPNFACKKQGKRGKSGRGRSHR